MSESIPGLLAGAVARLTAAGVESCVLDAQLMMARALNTSRLSIIAHPDQPLSACQIAEFAAMVDRRASREPLAYILGVREFYGLEFNVTPETLIPRPETETLVDAALDRVGRRPAWIADVGTGSGAVAIALAVNLPAARVLAADISAGALEVAKANAEKHLVADRVSFVRGDLIEPLRAAHRPFDAIVCNPPYIPTARIASLQPEVGVWEPVAALDGGQDGLDAYRGLVPAARDLLAPNGFVAVEVGVGQAEEVRDMAVRARYGRVDCIRDLAGIERVVVASI